MTGPSFAAHLPPSALRLLRVLHDVGPLTVSEAASLAALRPRTVRFALAALRRAGLLRERPVLGDLRRKRVAALEPPAPAPTLGPTEG